MTSANDPTKKIRSKLLSMSLLLVVMSNFIVLSVVAVSYHRQGKWRSIVSGRLVEERLGGVFAAINDFPGSAGNDLRFLRSLSDVRAYAASADNQSRTIARADIQEFLERNGAYEEIYLETDGCLSVIQRLAEVSNTPDCIQSSVIREQIAELGHLPDDIVHVSPLIRFQKSNGSTITALIYGTRIPATQGRGGKMTAVINADYFLNEVRRLQRQDEGVFLLGQDGSYIANPDQSKEQITGGKGNFYTDYPEVTKGVLSDKNIKQVQRGNRLFSFLRLSPTTNNFALYDGSHAEHDQEWVLVAVSEHVDTSVWWSSGSFRTTAALVVAIHVVTGLIFYLALFPARAQFLREHHNGSGGTS